MINARTVAIALISLVVFGLAVSIISAWLPPSHRQVRAHSYSGRVTGYRALYELLGSFNVETTRGTSTPAQTIEDLPRIVLLEPDVLALRTERGYLEKMASFVREGGELVLVMGGNGVRQEMGIPSELVEKTLKDILGEKGPIEILGIENLEIRSGGAEPTTGPYSEWKLDKVITDRLAGLRRPEMSWSVEVSGSFAHLGDSLNRLELPIEPAYFDGSGLENAAGKVSVSSSSGETFPIVLEYALGKGRLTLVAETAFLNNLGIGKADNAVLAYHVAAGAGARPVVIDEYYHGALPQGNPFALAALFPFNVIALSILLAALTWAWSVGIRFGPPVAEPEPSRRNILEYVDAMANVFRRGRKHHFVLRTCRDGLLEEVRAELRLSHGTREELVLDRLTRRDPSRAERLRNTLEQIGAALGSSEHIPRHALARYQERLDTCRNTIPPHSSTSTNTPLYLHKAAPSIRRQA